MRTDLEQALAEMARSVHDDGATDRMSGQVRTMVGRVRRRRAARHVAAGAVGVGAVAAIAFGGSQLVGLGDDEPLPPAGPSPAPRTSVDACGLTLEEAGWVQQGPATLVPYDEAPAGRADGGVTVATELEEIDVELELDGTPATAYVAVDAATGRVVGVPEPSDWTPDWGALVDLVGPEAAQRFMSSTSVVLRDCDADPGAAAGLPGTAVPPGEYDVFGMLPLTPVETYEGLDAFVAVGGPWRITTGEGGAVPDQDLTAEQREARDAVDAWLAEPEPNPEGVFPRCGSLVPDADDDVPLALDVATSRTVFDSGELGEGAVSLRTTDGRAVTGDASPVATLVVLQDSVVVGYQWLDVEELVPVDLADGRTTALPMRVSMNVCGTGDGGAGPLLPLPPGEYQAVAALDVMLTEVTDAEGAPEEVTGTVHVVSPPLDVTVR